MKQEQNTEEEIAWNDNEDCKETKHTIVEFKSSLNRENNIIEEAEDWSDDIKDKLDSSPPPLYPSPNGEKSGHSNEWRGNQIEKSMDSEGVLPSFWLLWIMLLRSFT